MLGGNESYIYGISDFTIGNTVTYKIDKYTSGVDNLTVKIGSTVVATRNNVSGDFGGTFTNTITFSSSELTAIYKAMPNVTRASFTFTITTVISGVTEGSTNATATGTIADSIKPSISSVALSEAVSGIAAQFGGYVQNQSKISGTITATAGTGSTISSYKTLINGQTITSSTFMTSVLKTAGTNTVTVTVTDRRGRTATSTSTFTVLACDLPKITNFKVVRCLADGTEDVSGEYVKINATASISPVNNKNKKSFVLEYKQKSATSYTSIETYTGGYTYTLTNKIQAGISSDYPYDFRLRAIDFVHEAISSVSISSGFALIDLKGNGKGLAFGKVASEDNTLDIGFDNTFLSKETYVGGSKRNNDEKNIYFQTAENDAEYPSNCKIYGGRGESSTGIGMWDMGNDRQIYSYFPSLKEFKFGADLTLNKGTKQIINELTRTSGNNTGVYHYSNGLLIQFGTVSITPIAANTSTLLTVTYPVAYTNRPNLFVTPQTSIPEILSVAVGQGSVNYVDFGIYITRTNTNPTTIHWLSIGYKAP